MKEEVKRILLELQTSDGIEVLKLNWNEITDYREKGYYVLTGMVLDMDMDQYGKELCYLSKDEDKLKRKMDNMKNPKKWNVFSKLREW